MVVLLVYSYDAHSYMQRDYRCSTTAFIYQRYFYLILVIISAYIILTINATQTSEVDEELKSGLGVIATYQIRVPQDL